MSYNPRQSNMFPRSSQNMKTPASVSRKKQQQQKQSSFDHDLLISDSEILDCLQELGIQFGAQDLAQPTPIRVFSVFENFADQLMSVRKETIEPLVRGAAEDHDYPDGLYDAGMLTVFFQNLNNLMQECGVVDFTLSDFQQPRSDRLKYILSCIINFLRYRTEKNATIQKYYAKGEEAREKSEALIEENEMLKQRIMELRAQREREAPAIAQAAQMNESLTNDLRALKRAQAHVSEETEKWKAEKKRLIRSLEQVQNMNVMLQRECARLEPYIVDSPEKLTQAIADMNASLSNERNSVDSTERRVRALQTSADSFQLVEQDINSCIKLMEDCEKDILKLEECRRKVQRHEEMVHQKEAECREIERKEERLSRLHSNALEKLDKARAQAAAKRDQAMKESEAMKAEYDSLSKAREEAMREMDKKNQQIDIKQKEMADLKERIEEECKQARIQYETLASRINMYITKMQQQMARV